MGIITISRQIGAGETTIVPELGRKLGWKIADQSIMNRECEITGLGMLHVLYWDEHDPTFLDMLNGRWAEFAAFLTSSRTVMQELADADNVIIVGRGGNLLLHGHPETLHVRLIADLGYRVKRVMENRWCSEDRAREIIEKHDRNSSMFYRHIFHADQNDPMLYDMILRTDIVGLDGVVDILANHFSESNIEKQREFALV